MVKIYKLITWKEPINGVYYDKHDAIDSAKQVQSDMNVPVEIWEAEEIEGVPQYMLDWSRIGVVDGAKNMQVWDVEKVKNCPFKDLIQEWDDDDGDIITLLCEGCADRDECN